MTNRTPSQLDDAGCGRNRARQHLPDYVIEIAISPQLCERDPCRPLSLQEALDLGRRPQARAEPPEPEAEA